MRWKDDIPEEVKEDRLRRLIELQETILAKHREQMLGKTVEVLVEKHNFKDEAFLKGRTRCWKNVLFPGDPLLVGTLQKVTIHSFSNQTLFGNLAGSPAENPITKEEHHHHPSPSRLIKFGK